MLFSWKRFNNPPFQKIEKEEWLPVQKAKRTIAILGPTYLFVIV